MKITQNFFNNFLKKNYLFEKNPKIAVAVSGGPDSMCLVNLLSKWIKKTQGSLMVLIIDHKIRESSSNEAKYVKNILANLKIESSIIRVNKNYIAKNTMNEARKNRFILLGIMTAAGWDFYQKEWWHYQLFNSKKFKLIKNSMLKNPMM